METTKKRSNTRGDSVTIYFTEEWSDLLETLREESKRERRSLSQVILLALESAKKNEVNPASPKTR